MPRAVTCYREFAPCDALRQYVRAFFSFTPAGENASARRWIISERRLGEGDPFSAPLFADGQVSIVFDGLGRACHPEAGWKSAADTPGGTVIGAASAAGEGCGPKCPEMVGVYLQPAQSSMITGVSASDLTDRVVQLENLWGSDAVAVSDQLASADAAARLDLLEQKLLARLRQSHVSASAVDVAGLARWVLRSRGRLTVQQLAGAAGVSRQYLTRLFHERVGVTPKVYCRLARFQSGLAYAGCGQDVDWAGVAIDLGYADQSHMIAEFRQFSRLTPAALTTGNWFHPFIERSRAKKNRDTLAVAY